MAYHCTGWRGGHAGSRMGGAGAATASGSPAVLRHRSRSSPAAARNSRWSKKCARFSLFLIDSEGLFTVGPSHRSLDAAARCGLRCSRTGTRRTQIPRRAQPKPASAGRSEDVGLGDDRIRAKPVPGASTACSSWSRGVQFFRAPALAEAQGHPGGRLGRAVRAPRHRRSAACRFEAADVSCAVAGAARDRRRRSGPALRLEERTPPRRSRHGSATGAATEARAKGAAALAGRATLAVRRIVADVLDFAVAIVGSALGAGAGRRRRWPTVRSPSSPRSAGALSGTVVAGASITVVA